ncbi:polysaccharide deacetylase family protein [Patescibacteria group bacterium]|nr:polysaccharide deacetylase family protein [Patescibacteria group bacterium]
MINKPKFIFTVDVEEWYHQNFNSIVNGNIQPNYNAVVSNTLKILDLLDLNNSKGTFFFLGCIASEYPDLLKEVSLRGHEIASHGFAHRLVNNMNESEFETDLVQSIEAIEKITGLPVKGYRAASWSMSNKTKGAYKILMKHNFTYDSSIFPFATYLYGSNSAPLVPHKIIYNQKQLIEIPASIFKFGGFRIPFGGGFYFRFYPYFFTKCLFNCITPHQSSSIFYIHPREIDQMSPRLKLPLKDYFVSYINIGNPLVKLSKILKDFNAITINDFIRINRDNINKNTIQLNQL